MGTVVFRMLCEVGFLKSTKTKKIQNEMRKNKLPTNKEFIEKFGNLIDNYN